LDSLTHEEFGEAFLRAAVTPERIASAIHRIAGDSVVVGPLRAGPGGAASVVAKGELGEPAAEVLPGEALAFAVRLPVRLRITVRVGALGRFEAAGEVRLHISVGTRLPLAIIIELARVRPEHVEFAIEAKGVPSKVMNLAADVEGELRRRTADYINARVANPDASSLTNIELLPLIESGWRSTYTAPGPTLGPDESA
jgi:hypothetical protein